MLALFKQQFYRELGNLVSGRHKAGKVSVATGMAACEFIKGLGRAVEAGMQGLKVNVQPITNRFFGETIDVAGLVTGGDLVGQLEGKDLGGRLLIPQSMLKSGEEVFLDDVTVTQVEERLCVKVEVCEVHGAEFLRSITREGAQWANR